MEVRKTLFVEHSAEQMFDLIEAAERYPEFLPWCAAATIVERDADVVAADVTVDYHGVRFHFRTRNPKRPPLWMALKLEQGPFHHFEGEWNLKPLASDGCRIDFLLRYAFKHSVAGRLAAPVFERIANTLVDAFVERADRVYAAAAVPGRGSRMELSGATSSAPATPSTATSAPPADSAAGADITAPAGNGGETDRSQSS